MNTRPVIGLWAYVRMLLGHPVYALRRHSAFCISRAKSAIRSAPTL